MVYHVDWEMKNMVKFTDQLQEDIQSIKEGGLLKRDDLLEMEMEVKGVKLEIDQIESDIRGLPR